MGGLVSLIAQGRDEEAAALAAEILAAPAEGGEEPAGSTTDPTAVVPSGTTIESSACRPSTFHAQEMRPRIVSR